MERLYNVPLRRKAMKSPIHSRAKRATKALREFVVKHMKSEDVVFTAPVNERIWERGMRTPPHHIKIRATKDKEGKVTVELADGTVKETPKETAKAPAKTPVESKQEEAPEAKPTASATGETDSTKTGSDATPSKGSVPEKKAGSKPKADASEEKPRSDSKSDEKTASKPE